MKFEQNQELIFNCSNTGKSYKARVVCTDMNDSDGRKKILTLVSYPEGEIPIIFDRHGFSVFGTITGRRLFFVNVYKSGPEGRIHMSKEAADREAFFGRVKCIEVEY